MTIEQLQSKFDKLQNEFNEFVKNSKKEKVWKFTEKQKAFLKMLDKKWKYIARDESGSVYIFDRCPTKDSCGCWIDGGKYWMIADDLFEGSAFNNIQWYDTEPCEFRKYIGDSDD